MQKDKIFFSTLSIIVLLFLFIAGVFFKDIFSHTDFVLSEAEVVFINETSIKIEVADTSAKRKQGLSERASLGVDEGMFFVFGKPQRGGIWMKDMYFPIDIIWLDKDLFVVYIKQNAQPESYPEIFYPQKNAKYVLEVNTDFTKQHNILVGDQLHF